MTKTTSGTGMGSHALRMAVYLGLLWAAACGGGQAGRPDEAPEQAAAPAPTAAEVSAVDRGKYLVSITGCHDCHTPFKMGPTGPEPDMTRMLQGHPQEISISGPPTLSAPWVWAGAESNTAFAGPWGISYAFNLTPDKETGIGLWSEQVFVNTIKTGRHMGVGRPILPPMPWPVYRNMTDEDLKALFGYLMTIEPKKNTVPDAVINQPPPAGGGAPSTPPTP